MQQLKLKEDDLVVINEILVHRARESDKLEEGTLGTQTLQHAALHFEKDKAIGKVVKVEAWSEYKECDESIASSVNVVVDTYTKAETKINSVEFEKYILQTFHAEIFCKDQRFIIRWPSSTGINHWFQLRIADVYLNVHTGIKKQKIISKFRDYYSVQFAKVHANETTVTILAANNPWLKIEQTSIFQLGPDWDPEALGLDKQFRTIFQRAFTSRLYPPDAIKSLGVKHVKGVLLYGPPGTGKTLIARNISKMLTNREPQVVNGLEIFSNFVDDAQANIRKLFADAIEEQKEKGNESSLHVIIFDEIDAIYRQKGTVTSGTSIHDTVVNQLLSMINGVNALNNILVIGITNRKDMLDDALLESGRLEVHIKTVL